MKKIECLIMILCCIIATDGYSQISLTPENSIERLYRGSLKSKFELIRADGNNVVMYNRMEGENLIATHRFTFKTGPVADLVYFDITDPTIDRAQAYYHINDMYVRGGVCYFCGSVQRSVPGLAWQDPYHYAERGIVGKFSISQASTTCQIAEIPEANLLEKISVDAPGEHIYAVGLYGPSIEGAFSSPNHSLLIDLLLSPAGSSFDFLNTSYCVIEPDSNDERFVDVTVVGASNVAVSSRYIGNHTQFGIRISKGNLFSDVPLGYLSHGYKINASFHSNTTWDLDIDRVLVDASFTGTSLIAAHSYYSSSTKSICVYKFMGDWSGMSYFEQQFDKGTYTRLSDLTVVDNGPYTEIVTVSQTPSGSTSLNHTYDDRFEELYINSNVRYYYTKNLVLPFGGKLTSAAYLNADNVYFSATKSSTDQIPLICRQNLSQVDEPSFESCLNTSSCYSTYCAPTQILDGYGVSTTNSNIALNKIFSYQVSPLPVVSTTICQIRINQ